jgi:hypothetical protein
MNREDIEAILTATADERICQCAAAWLRAWRRARWLAFDETVALRQAGAAWDRAVQDLAAAAAIATPEVN